MPPFRIPIDGLWRCLCPSIVTAFIPRTPTYLSKNARAARPRVRQFYRTSKALDISNPTPRIPTENPSGTFQAFKVQPEEAQNKSIPPRKSIFSQRPNVSENRPFSRFNRYSIPQLHDKLRELPSEPNTYHEIAELVYYLIDVRGEKPALIHYDALVRANSDAENGSVDILKGLLQEMEELEVRGDTSFYEGVLLVLAVHPDYILRGEIMKMMKERWFGLSPKGWHWLVVGLLRDRHYEMAMDKLGEMQTDQVTIQPWLYDIFMYQLCEADELDEAWKLLKYRWEHARHSVLSNVYYHLLDRFSRGYHYDGVKFIWKVRVQSDIIVPSDGMCISVLNVAARYADSGLATSAMRILSSRRLALAPYHYEALISAYAGSGDLMTAFRLLTIMTKAGVEPSPSTTRPLYVHLSQNQSLPRQAWQTLKQLFEDGHAVPIAAVNVVIESYIAIHKFDDAMDAYKGLHTICEAGPDTETFNVLFQGSTRNERKETSMFLASEMHALGIPADNLTYDRLILVCLKPQDYEDAFRYLAEMIEVGKDRVDEGTGKKGWWMRRGTATLMVRTCVNHGDERVWGILREMRERGMSIEILEGWVAENWQGREEREVVADEERAELQKVVEDVRKKQEKRLRKWNATQ